MTTKLKTWSIYYEITEQLISMRIPITTVLNNITLNCYKKKILHVHLRPIISGLLVVSLASVFILDHFHQCRDSNVNAFTEVAYVRDQHGDNSIDDYLSYYSSIFSNLSRGLPINGGVSISEPATGQEAVAGEEENSDSTHQDSQQEQIEGSQPRFSNNSQ